MFHFERTRGNDLANSTERKERIMISSTNINARRKCDSASSLSNDPSNGEVSYREGEGGL